MNALPQFMTEIDGLDIHFIHVRSKHENAWLPGFGFSARPTTTGWGPDRTVRAWLVLMKSLGYTRFAAQGGDLGAGVCTAMAKQAPPELLGIHTNFPGTIPLDILRRRFSAAIRRRRAS